MGRSFSISPDYITTTQFDLISADVTILSTPEDSVILELGGPDAAFDHSFDSSGPGHLAVRQNSRTGGVGRDGTDANSGNTPTVKLWLPEPKRLATSHSVTTITGNVSAEGVTCRTLQIVTAEGGIALRSLNANALSVRSNIGDVSAEQVSIDSAASIRTEAGDIKILSSRAPVWNIAPNLGNLTVQQTLGDIKFLGA